MVSGATSSRRADSCQPSSPRNPEAASLPRPAANASRSSHSSAQASRASSLTSGQGSPNTRWARARRRRKDSPFFVRLATSSPPDLTASSATWRARTQFGQAWTDDTDRELTRPWGHNGCDTRNDALARDLVEAHLKPGSRCVVVSGRLHDPYTGSTLAWRRGRHTSTTVQIDHVVALGNAWITGAQKLSPLQRTALANDPLNLLAVDGPANEAKRDRDAATWLPPNKAYRCDYVARQIAVKTKYQLWVTPAEKTAMARVLHRCPAQTLPVGATR